MPLIKVGRDLAPEAAELLRGLSRLTPGARCIEVPAPNNRVVLHYQSAERRCERMSGGVPGWTWVELGPMVRDLDAIYLNFISGFELALGTAQALRRGFRGPIYADLHSLFLGMQHDGMRVLQPLADAHSLVRVLRRGPAQRGRDAPAVAGSVVPQRPGTQRRHVAAGGDAGAEGAAYVAAAGFEGLGTLPEARPLRSAQGDSLEGSAVARASQLAARTALIPAPQIDAVDPTGCGDVFGAAACARLLAGDPVEDALRHATAMAARNATLRGAGGLSRHLRGELLVP